MAIYRKINTTFWSDPFICDLPADKKLFYLYLLTNERTKQCGIYDISKKQISYDLGINVNKVTENINFFQSKGKLMFSDGTNEIALKNWFRFNGSTSPKVVKCVESELKLVKNRVLIEYIYSMHTASQQTQAPTEEETPAKEEAEVKKKFSPPTISEVEEYFFENGYSKESGKRAFQYYDVSNWIDSKNNHVKNWKQKMLSVWFKDENKIKPIIAGSNKITMASPIM